MRGAFRREVQRTDALLINFYFHNDPFSAFSATLRVQPNRFVFPSVASRASNTAQAAILIIRDISNLGCSKLANMKFSMFSNSYDPYAARCRLRFRIRLHSWQYGYL